MLLVVGCGIKLSNTKCFRIYHLSKRFNFYFILLEVGGI